MTHQPTELVQIVDKAIELMSVPHAVVDDYGQFVADTSGENLEYGDPTACRFCVAGVVRHAAVLLRAPGRTFFSIPDHLLTDDEEDAIAAACLHPHGLLDLFDRAWHDHPGGDERDPEEAREIIVGHLRSGREVLFIKAGEPDELALTS